MNKVYVVSHTHWDREWYKTKSEYQIMLKRGIEYLIGEFEKGNVERFFLDGQTIVVEDLKMVLSDEMFDKFIALIKSGVLEIGPWFVLPDEGLIDEVGLKMNLSLGIEICKSLNVRHSGVLYMPDTFGHSSGMPRIASDLGIKYAVIHRGILSDEVDVTWKHKGANLKTVCLATREGYYQTAFHSNDYIDRFDSYCQEYLKGNDKNDVLFLNGCDHTFIPSDFKKKLENLREVFDDKYEIIEVTLSEFFKLNNYSYSKQVKGELRSNARAFLLPGVLSTRQYLKRENRYCIDYLNSVYKPLLKHYHLETEDNNVRYLEKMIIKNHPHDSICGCSIDEVHRQMETRFCSIKDNIKQSVDIILHDNFIKKIGMSSIDSWYENNKIVIYNHVSIAKHLVNIDIDLVNNDIEECDICLINGHDSYTLSYVSSKKREILEHKYNCEPCYTNVNTINVAGMVNLYELLNSFEIKVVKKKSKTSNEADMSIIDLCNYHYISDRGDSYNFDPVGEYKKIKNISHEVKDYTDMTVHNIVSSCSVGTNLDDSREKRNSNYSDLVILTKIKICKKTNDRIFSVKINNVHGDIKVVNIYNGIDSVYTDTACDLIERKEIAEIKYDAIEKNTEVLYNQYPSLTSILVNKSYQISHIGLNEVEVIKESLIHTLFRATGDLSRRDLKSRRGGAGPSYEAIENQCLKTMEFEYMLSDTNEYIKNEHLKLYPFIVHQYE